MAAIYDDSPDIEKYRHEMAESFLRAERQAALMKAKGNNPGCGCWCVLYPLFSYIVNWAFLKYVMIPTFHFTYDTATVNLLFSPISLPLNVLLLLVSWFAKLINLVAPTLF